MVFSLAVATLKQAASKPGEPAPNRAHPAYLGHGRPLFDGYARPIDLQLLGQRSSGKGVTMHDYAIRTGGEAS